jgi:hypothetical protein
MGNIMMSTRDAHRLCSGSILSNKFFAFDLLLYKASKAGILNDLGSWVQYRSSFPDSVMERGIRAVHNKGGGGRKAPPIYQLSVNMNF